MSLTATAKIKAFWQDRALNASLGTEAVTHTDRNQRLLEIEVLLQYLPRGQRVLDIGCGNGYSTALIARVASQVVGIDYSEAMIERARQEQGHAANVEFRVADILNLQLPPASFDVAVSQRCLINLPSWEAQQQALRNISQVLKPGGCLFLQEGSRQGREKLNQAREGLGLSRMPPVDYNLDFDEDKLWPFLRQSFDIVEVRRFGLYDLISRVVHPLLVSPAEPRYHAKINEVAYRLAAKYQGADELSREFSAFLRRLEEPSH
jgi:SAM-dependent methyltransferase